MKELLILIFVAMSMTSLAQNKYVDGSAEEEEKKEETNKFLKGKFHLEPYIGVMSPTWLQNNMLVNRMTDSLNPTEYTSTGIPIVLGFKAEYMVSNTIGLGIDVNYQENGVTATTTQNFVDGGGNVVQQEVQNVWTEQKLRIMARFQAHFGNSNKIDWYGGAAVGVGLVLNRNDPSYTQFQPDLNDYPVILRPTKLIDFATKDMGLPIAIRGYIGARFMVSNNFGILTEVGLFSGALLNVGATIRF